MPSNNISNYILGTTCLSACVRCW